MSELPTVYEKTVQTPIMTMTGSKILYEMTAHENRVTVKRLYVHGRGGEDQHDSVTIKTEIFEEMIAAYMAGKEAKLRAIMADNESE